MARDGKLFAPRFLHTVPSHHPHSNRSIAAQLDSTETTSHIHQMIKAAAVFRSRHGLELLSFQVKRHHTFISQVTALPVKSAFHRCLGCWTSESVCDSPQSSPLIIICPQSQHKGFRVSSREVVLRLLVVHDFHYLVLLCPRMESEPKHHPADCVSVMNRELGELLAMCRAGERVVDVEWIVGDGVVQTEDSIARTHQIKVR
ncbi:unnamed protein product [Linum tenue]|uniref:Uncharacterized protein n=1 Tax=Linum tenue TaxID=586396 RepID=A0AAV0IK02_9ROSI|nr:unnamed protein product [Linum tenue]